MSAVQAGLISSAAAANPAEERRLIELASRVSLAELREECARVRAAADPDPEATNRRLHAGRRLRRYLDSEGFWNLHANGTPQAGAAFNAVLDPIIDRIFKTARAHGQREHPDAYAFDALMHLAEHAAGHCDCHQPTQPTRGADHTADTADGTGDAEADATQVDAAEADAAGRYDAIQADAAGAGAAPAGLAPVVAAQADAAGASADGPDADAGLNGAASPATAAGADRNGKLGSAPAGSDPGIFAANAGSVGRAGSALGCVVRPSQSVNPRYLALLRVDAQALRRGHVAG